VNPFTTSRAKATVHAWLHSPEHRAILLSSTYRRVGIGRKCGRFLGYTDELLRLEVEWAAPVGVAGH
jgi:hypothetical protein